MPEGTKPMPDFRFVTSFVRHAIVLAAAGSLIAACGGVGGSAAASGSAAAPASAAASAPAGTAIAGASGSGTATSVDASESEFKIDLATNTSTAGPVTFHIKNAGTMVHEFVVLQTDLAADKLPVTSGAPEVDEDADELTAVDEVEDIAVGASEDLTVDLKAGHYVVICNVPGHYQAGMRTELTVEGG
jgi:uncharacterized cupredoxin-like copper-binding protein